MRPAPSDPEIRAQLIAKLKEKFPDFTDAQINEILSLPDEFFDKNGRALPTRHTNKEMEKTFDLIRRLADAAQFVSCLEGLDELEP